MNTNEAGQLMAQMVTLWHHAAVPKETVKLWVGMLDPLDAETCWRVFERLRGESEFFPSWAEFIQLYGALRPRQPEEFHRALPAPPVDREAFKAGLAKAREALAEAQRRLAEDEPLTPIEQAGLDRVARERADGTLDVELLDRMMADFRGH